MALRLVAMGQALPIRVTAWYRKSQATFSDVLAIGQPGPLGRKVFHELNGSTPTSRIDPRGLGGLAGSTRFHSLNGQSRDKTTALLFFSKFMVGLPGYAPITMCATVQTASGFMVIFYSKAVGN
jgi:hypothetical protein